MTDPVCVWPVQALLGEGPIWYASEQVVWFTDIKGRRLHRYDPATGARVSYDVPGGPGFVVPAHGGGLIVGMDRALYRFTNGAITDAVLPVNTAPHNRINDGTVDAQGRIWFGTMDDAETEPTGAVHMHDGDLTHNAGGACVITNGPAITADGALLYHVDSQDRSIWRFDITDGHVLDKATLFTRLTPQEGYPDGVSVDAAGNLWVALWGGWCVRRYSPDGVLQLEIKLPVALVTKLALGGADLRTAYVTTARIGLSASEHADQPLAGGLFSFPVDVPGVELPLARLA